MTKEIKEVIANVANSTGVAKKSVKDKVKELTRLGYTDKQVCEWLWKYKRRVKGETKQTTIKSI